MFMFNDIWDISGAAFLLFCPCPDTVLPDVGVDIAQMTTQIMEEQLH